MALTAVARDTISGTLLTSSLLSLSPSLSIFLFLSLAYRAPDCSVLLRSRHRTRSLGPPPFPRLSLCDKRGFGCRQCRSSASSRRERSAISDLFRDPEKNNECLPRRGSARIRTDFANRVKETEEREEDCSCKRQRQLENCRGNFSCGLISKGNLFFLAERKRVRVE